MDLTNGDLKTMMLKRSGGKAVAEEFFSGIHSISKNKISVRLRQDRQLLVVIFEQGKQRLQVVADQFPTQEAAAKLMVSIAEDYVNNKIATADLKAVREDRIKAAGIPSRCVRKRPASAVAMKRPSAAQVCLEPPTPNPSVTVGEHIRQLYMRVLIDAHPE